MAQDGAAVRSVEALPPAVSGPSVWYGPDMARRTDWVHTLSAGDVAEIEMAMRPLAEREADIARITKADFPLPTLAGKLARIRAEVIDGRGFALLRGLPVESPCRFNGACRRGHRWRRTWRPPARGLLRW